MSLNTPAESAARLSGALQLDEALAFPRIAIESVEPQLEGGRFAAKAIEGEARTVTAVIFADGHDKLAGQVLWRLVEDPEWQRVPLEFLGNDHWQASFVPPRVGRVVFAVEAWWDLYGSYCYELSKKHGAGVPIKLELQEGELLLRQALEQAPAALVDELQALLTRLEETQSIDERVALLLAPETVAAVTRVEAHPHRVRSPLYPLDVERKLAEFASWYELFPRSAANDGKRHGTFRDVIARLPDIQAMGFDVLYFPPIHPIGRTHRKGPNNSLKAGPDDPGSPYAIGSAEGGHEAIHPQLGSREDFQALVQAAREHGLEIALDFAIQCSPDHPWLAQHPGWFSWRPDGSIRHAENPPKKYEDIVNVDFYARDAQPDLWLALRDVVKGWVEQGVTLFRVDNPHTKPLPFWEWLIADIRAAHPEVIFLAEAFTRPAVMARLGKVGFTQSYTYFTWRNTKEELAQYFTELNQPPLCDCYRPNFFVNTPDINPSRCTARAAPPSSSAPPWRPWAPASGACTRASRSASRHRCRARSTWIRRSTSCASATTGRPATSSARSPSSTASAAPTRRCRPTWGCRSTTPGTTTSCTSASAPPTAPTSSSSPSASTRTTPRRRTSSCRCGNWACRGRRHPRRGPDERPHLDLARQDPVDAHRALAPALRHLAHPRRDLRAEPWRRDSGPPPSSTTRSGTRTR